MATRRRRLARVAVKTDSETSARVEFLSLREIARGIVNAGATAGEQATLVSHPLPT